MRTTTKFYFDVENDELSSAVYAILKDKRVSNLRTEQVTIGNGEEPPRKKVKWKYKMTTACQAILDEFKIGEVLNHNEPRLLVRVKQLGMTEKSLSPILSTLKILGKLRRNGKGIYERI